MEEDTTISQALYITDGSADYDQVCKRLLAEKPILARLMKACLDEFRDCDVKDIEEKYIEGQPQVSSVPVMPDEEGSLITGMDTADKTVHEGTVLYDIRFRAIVPGTGERISIIINVEAQNDFYPGYPLLMRAVFYCCRMISSQYGREFTSSHYERIKKVYSIWICTNPPKNRRNTITRYRLAEENLVGSAAEPAAHYDLLSVIMLCLGGPEDDNYSGILRMLDVLLSSETSEADKRKILRDDYDIPMTHILEKEVSAMCNLSKGVMEKGMKLGMERGMEQGVVKGRVEALRNLMETLNLTVEQAMAALKVPDGERRTYLELLGKQ